MKTMPNPPQSTKNNTLVVRCRRADLGTDYARFVVGHYNGTEFDPFPCRRRPANALQISFGYQNLLSIPNHFVVELYPFAAYEEACQVHDGYGWNLDEVRAWIEDLEIQGQFNDHEPAGAVE